MRLTIGSTRITTVVLFVYLLDLLPTKWDRTCVTAVRGGMISLPLADQEEAIPESPALSPRLGRIATLILWLILSGFCIELLYALVVQGQRTSSVGSFAFWYAIPALIVLLCAAALRSTTERRVATAVLLVSIIGSALAAEAVLRAFPQRVAGFSLTTVVADSVCPGEYRRQAGCLAAAEEGRPFDRRTTLEVVEDFEAQGMEVWPSIDASHYLDPEYSITVDGELRIPLSPGMPEVLTVFCNEAGEWVTYESDEYGFNNPVGAHRPGVAKTAIVGDSFVHGWCVPFEQTLVARVAEADSAVLGLGLEGSGPLVQLGIEREFLASIRPDVVVWVFFEGNDLRDLKRELAHEVLPRYLDQGFSQGLRELTPALEHQLRDQVMQMRREEVARAAGAQQAWETARRRRASLAGWLRLTELRSRVRELGKSRAQPQPYDPPMFEQVAARMRDDVADWGGTLLFAYMPSRRRFEDSSTANPHRDSILARVGELGIPVIDLYEPLSAHPDPLSLYPFRIENHLTAEGYELAAQAVREGVQAHLAMVTE